MYEKLKLIVKKLNSKKILALVFMCFFIFVGAATFPLMLSTLVGAQENSSGLLEIKDTIDEEYKAMLTMTFDQPTLQNKGTYVNFNGLMARIMGQRYMNERIKLDNGHLTSLKSDPTDIMPGYEQMVKLNSHQVENNKFFLFVLAPYQVSKYDSKLPVGYPEYSNASADQIVELLRGNNVSVLDLREKMYEQGINYDDAFFKTDHHWAPQAGFWAYTEIIKALTEVEVIPKVDSAYTDSDNFEFRLYKDCFLGSAGKRTGQYYAGVDDFQLVIPKFETNMTLDIPLKKVDNSGEFEDVANRRMDFTDIDYFNSNPYASYGYSNCALSLWRNEEAPISKKVLMIGDSFGNIPFSLLPLCFTTCDEMDMRDYAEDFQDYYYDFDPDIVIVLVNTDGLNGENIRYDFYPEE